MEYDDDLSQEALDDAIVEDTTHCQCCEARFVLGGNNYVLVEVPAGPLIDQPQRTVAQLLLCVDCAKAVHDEYRKHCEECGVDP